jgi:hypothetical protein
MTHLRYSQELHVVSHMAMPFAQTPETFSTVFDTSTAPSRFEILLNPDPYIGVCYGGV